MSMTPPEYYDPPYLDEEEHANTDHTGIPGVGGGGGPVDLSNYEGDVGLTTSGEDSQLRLTAEGINSQIFLESTVPSSSIYMTSAGVGSAAVTVEASAGDIDITANDDIVFSDSIGTLTLAQIRELLEGY